MIRRDFLRIAGATPLIYGLGDLFAQDTAMPEWYTAALKRMKETRRHGLVLVVPAGDAARAQWGEALLALLDADHDDVREILGLAVVVCVTPEIAAKTVRAAGSKDNRFLLDPDGKKLSSDTIDEKALAADAFIKDGRELLHGDRLKAVAEAMLKDAPDSVKTALDKLASETLEARDEARGVLEAKADSIFPLLVWTRLSTKNTDVSSSIRAVVRGWTKALKSRVPFGAKLDEVPSEVDPCPGCGMAETPAKARKVLSFLAK